MGTLSKDEGYGSGAESVRIVALALWAYLFALEMESNLYQAKSACLEANTGKNARRRQFRDWAISALVGVQATSGAVGTTLGLVWSKRKARREPGLWKTLCSDCLMKLNWSRF